MKAKTRKIQTRKRKKTYRCGFIMNCPNRGPNKGFRCMWCSLTLGSA